MLGYSYKKLNKSTNKLWRKVMDILEDEKVFGLQDAVSFMKRAKQPAAYFDTADDRYRFQNVEYEGNKAIYKYSSVGEPDIEIVIRN